MTSKLRLDIRDNLLCHPDLSRADILVLNAIFSNANDNDDEWCDWHANNWFAMHCGLNERSVRRSIQKLEKLGILKASRMMSKSAMIHKFPERGQSCSKLGARLLILDNKGIDGALAVVEEMRCKGREQQVSMTDKPVRRTKLSDVQPPPGGGQVCPDQEVGRTDWSDEADKETPRIREINAQLVPGPAASSGGREHCESNARSTPSAPAAPPLDGSMVAGPPATSVSNCDCVVAGGEASQLRPHPAQSATTCHEVDKRNGQLRPVASAAALPGRDYLTSQAEHAGEVEDEPDWETLEQDFQAWLQRSCRLDSTPDRQPLKVKIDIDLVRQQLAADVQIDFDADDGS